MLRFTYLFLALILVVLELPVASAKPYGPTLNEVADKYLATKNFQVLQDNLNREVIAIQLGMSVDDVQKWSQKSRFYKIDSADNAVYKFKPVDFDGSMQALCFDVWFTNGEVSVIKTYNLNNFECEESDLAELKALKPVRVNECWVKQNYVDTNAKSNGYDFVLMTEFTKPEKEDSPCMGSDRANITIGKPGLLYPKHVK